MSSALLIAGQPANRPTGQRVRAHVALPLPTPSPLGEGWGEGVRNAHLFRHARRADPLIPTFSPWEKGCRFA